MKTTKHPDRHRGIKKKKVKKIGPIFFLFFKKRMETNTHGDTDEVEEIEVQKNR